MGIYGHKFDNLRTDLHPEIVQEGIVDAFKSIIESIKKGIVNLIDKINGWLDKHPDSKVAMGLKSILTKLKNLLTKADKIKSKEDAEEVKSEVDKNKEEAEDLMKKSEPELSPEFKEAVDKKNVLRVRIMLKDSIQISYKNNTPEELNKELEYASKNIPDLFIKDNGEGYEPKSEWNEDYYNSQAVALVQNFSKKRWNHCKEVWEYLKKE